MHVQAVYDIGSYNCVKCGCKCATKRMCAVTIMYMYVQSCVWIACAWAEGVHIRGRSREAVGSTNKLCTKYIPQNSSSKLWKVAIPDCKCPGLPFYIIHTVSFYLVSQQFLIVTIFFFMATVFPTVTCIPDHLVDMMIAWQHCHRK